MQHKELIREVAAKMGPKVSADRAVKAVAEAIARALSDGEDVTLLGLGKFKVEHKAATTARNLQDRRTDTDCGPTQGEVQAGEVAARGA